MFKTIKEKFQEFRHYQASLRELAELSDRELADLNVCRGDLEQIVRNAYLTGAKAVPVRNFHFGARPATARVTPW
ncbi:MAG TPA: DUF1127 domain-containing protein [Beijerinckia sp.]|jgi:uncharacterized protein YjiS (DUF1127 family)|nr:DUF1127 domain-containing protein [Beijerinckia sp.]